MNKAERKRFKEQQKSENVVKIVKTAIVAKKAVVKHRDKIVPLEKQIEETKTAEDKTTKFAKTIDSQGSKDGTKVPERNEKTTTESSVKRIRKERKDDS